MPIHLIERQGFIRKVEGADGEWESGYWSLTPSRANQLIGDHIYFHEGQKEPSFYGGIILSCRVQPDGEYAGRIIFRFRYDPEHRGVRTHGPGWGNEMRIE